MLFALIVVGLTALMAGLSVLHLAVTGGDKKLETVEFFFTGAGVVFAIGSLEAAQNASLEARETRLYVEKLTKTDQFR